MSIKKFLAPNLIAIIVIAALWLTGMDPITNNKNDDRTNIQKYIQVEKRILDNYVDPVNVTKLYENSIRNMVAHLADSTIKIQGTPLDTTFTNVKVNDLRSSVLDFEKAYVYLANNYPKENMDKLTADAIRGMFRNLDPHSIYITAKDNKQVQEEFNGKFQGIGIQFDIINDTITVITPLAGGPSESVGIQSGDRIVTIDSSNAVGFSTEQVVNHLRGTKGSVVEVGIYRPHVGHMLHFKITRADIPLTTVDTYYMLDNKTGYIKISRFARTTHEEFVKAVTDLKSQGMTRLILDLRNNPGGFLDQAIETADEFFPGGLKLLSTKSRHPRYDQVFRSSSDGLFKHGQLMVLINKGSASASEIVTGSIQDHDRGLVVGQRSFGKGLVQQQYDLVDGSAIRVTISRYYTPSGRLIQKPYNKGREAYAYELYKRSNNARTDAEHFIDHVPDSLKYKTDAGRTVYGGGGIVPDHIIQEDTTTSYIYAFMQRKQLGTEFVLDYMRDHGKQIRNEYDKNFNSYRKNFHFSDKAMKQFHQLLVKNGLVESDTVKSPVYRKDTLFVNPTTYNKEKWIASGFMKAEMARQIWGQSHFYPVYNDIFDKTLHKAMTLWPEVKHLEAYAAIHTPENKETVEQQ